MADAAAHPYLQLLGGWTPSSGLVGRLEAVAPLTPRLSAYGMGQLSREGPLVSGGLRYTFR